MRDLVNVVSQTLISSGAEMRVAPRFWEGESARRGSTGHINDEFIEIARRCQHVIALLVTHLRNGTKEEIEAVLEDPDIQISLLVFPPNGDLNNSDDEVRELLAKYKEINGYTVCGDPAEDQAWIELTKVVLFAVFRYLTQEDEPMYETR